MAHSVAVDHSDHAAKHGHGLLDRLQHTIEHVCHLLPSQGPIAVFVHHNTLHPFEALPFEVAVQRGAEAFNCQPYLSEERYQHFLTTGRIQVADLQALLRKELKERADESVGPTGTRFDLRLDMARYPLRHAADAELRWFLAESDALRRFRADIPSESRQRSIDDTRRWVMRDLRNGHENPSKRELNVKQMVGSLVDHFGRSTLESWNHATWESFTLNLLWQICRQGVHGHHAESDSKGGERRLRDLLLRVTGVDADLWVHDLLIRFTGSFLDQGLSTWALPDRDLGFFESFSRLFRQPGGSPLAWLRPLRSELRRIAEAGMTALECIQESLELFGVAPEDWETCIAQTFLALPGWPGMVWQMETNAEWTVRPAPKGSLVGFLAVRLLLDRLAAQEIARSELGYRGPLSGVRAAAKQRKTKTSQESVNQTAFHVFQIAQLRGWKAEELFYLSRSDWHHLIDEINAFSSMERRRVLHLAYERRYRQSALDAIAAHAPYERGNSEPPVFQLITCIDDREESFRRHLEEVEPDCETYGAAGFFSVPIYYRGVADAHYVPLCPIVMKPKHYVREEVAFTLEHAHERRANTRRALGTATHRFHLGSRSFVAGAIAAMVGPLASIPLVMRVLLPRTTARIRKMFGRLVQPPQLTQLNLQRSLSPPSPEEGHRGFTLDEMADMVERLLRDIGLIKRFSELLVVIGHGSASLNNPHESAYNCGACGGGRGGPNARSMAAMANDPRVRRILLARGLDLPPETYVVGGFHNTCDDSVVFFDLDRLPASHRGVFSDMRRAVDRARELNAHERSRRFEAAPLDQTPEAALRHVEERSEDLSQARPEYNHATCAACFVGRRSRVRGLYLDRRCFLTSYDPTLDDAEQTILARILGAVIPVCAGISLEYYFSCVDPAGWGCGSKLPHNITSLLGVMEGAASDLRTGLSQQMVEIHEPLRILFMIQTTPEAMLRIIAKNPTISQLCLNRWVQLSVLDPNSQQIHILRDGVFHLHQPEQSELPRVNRSIDWYRGWRDHLGFAEITGRDEGTASGLTLHAFTESLRE